MAPRSPDPTTPAAPRTRGRVRTRLLGVAVGLAIGALAAEGLARLAAPSPGEELLFGAPEAVPAALYTADPNLRMVPTPGFRADITGLGYRVPVRINQHGYRGAEPGPGPRWIAAGDSFTIALQVREEATFAERLAGRLGVEVANAGVDGYSTWQATQRYEALADTIGADAVLLLFFLGNDLVDNARYLGANAGPPLGANAGPPLGANAGPPLGANAGAAAPPAPAGLSQDPVTRLLFTHSVAFAWTRVALRRWTATSENRAERARFQDELRIFAREGSRELADLLPRTEAALRALRDSAAARGDRLIVAVAPPAFAVDGRAAATLAAFGLGEPAVDAPREAVLHTLDTLGVARCDLSPALAAAAAAGPTPYLRFDGHWSASGHALVADGIATCIARSSPAPRPPD